MQAPLLSTRLSVEVHSSVQVDSSNRTIVTTSAIPANTTIFTIPSTSILTVSTGALSSILPADTLSLLQPWPALILTLMYETSLPSSKWQEYLESLPKEFDSLMYWSDAELQDLKGCAVVDKIGKIEADGLYNGVLKEFIEAHQDVFRNVDTSLDAFHRMGSLIMACASDLEVEKDDAMNHNSLSDDEEEEEEEETYKAMIPFTDLVHFDLELANTVLIHEKSHTAIQSTIPLPTGTTLYTSPGLLPQSDLLRRYGSIPSLQPSQIYPHDVVEISGTLVIDVITSHLGQSTTATTSPSLTETDKSNRLSYLLDESILEDSYDVDVSGDIPIEILVIIHTLQLSAEAFEHHARRGKDVKPVKDSFAKQVLLQVVKERMEQYDTTVRDDERILSEIDVDVQGEIRRRQRMAVQVRLGEKRILQKMEEVVMGWNVGDGEENTDTDEDDGRQRKRVKHV